MNSIVERLRQHTLHYSEQEEAFGLFQSQEQRIKELEHQVSDLETECAVHAVCTKARAEELAALRQRIDDAPVVAHITEDGKVFSNGFVRDTDKPLISKEDLK